MAYLGFLTPRDRPSPHRIQQKHRNTMFEVLPAQPRFHGGWMPRVPHFGRLAALEIATARTCGLRLWTLLRAAVNAVSSVSFFIKTQTRRPPQHPRIVSIVTVRGDITVIQMCFRATHKKSAHPSIFTGGWTDPTLGNAGRAILLRPWLVAGGSPCPWIGGPDRVSCPATTG